MKALRDYQHGLNSGSNPSVPVMILVILGTILLFLGIGTLSVALFLLLPGLTWWLAGQFQAAPPFDNFLVHLGIWLVISLAIGLLRRKD